MIWRVRAPRGDRDELVVDVPDGFVAWLGARASDPTVRSLDPYRDYNLDRSTLRPLRDELVRIEREHTDEVAAELAVSRLLPRDTVAREALLAAWVARSLASCQHHQKLAELAAAVALALEIGGSIHILGD